jgi:dihydropteroate synthase
MTTRLQPGIIRAGPHELRVGARTLVMGILNITPDSFSGDGLLLQRPYLALEQAHAMVAAGVDIVDAGGESTRPGSDAVPEEVELQRVVPVVRRLAAELAVPISIDTRKAGVAEAALAAGATIVNDVSGFDFDPRMADVVARSGAPVILQHWRKRPPDGTRDIVAFVAEGLEECVARARSAGIPRTQIVIDPGIGFAKGPAQSIEILRRVAEFRARLGLPILIGASRKSYIGRVLDLPIESRLEGSLATAAVMAAGRADAVRVHDVPETVRAVRMADAIGRGWWETPPAWHTVYLGLGANLGDRAATIAHAVERLGTGADLRVIRRSGLYETAPVGVTDQPSFLNAVLEAETLLTPPELLRFVKDVEHDLGRQARVRWGPREIDVDILLYGDERISTPELTIPHAELWNRLFVLVPLAELQPDLPTPRGSTLESWVSAHADEATVKPLGW